MNDYEKRQAAIEKKGKAERAKLATEIGEKVIEAAGKRRAKVTVDIGDTWNERGKRVLVKYGKEEDVEIEVEPVFGYGWARNERGTSVKVGSRCNWRTHVRSKSFRKRKDGTFNLDGIVAHAIVCLDAEIAQREVERAHERDENTKAARIRKALSSCIPKRYKYEQDGASFKVWKNEEYGGASVRVREVDDGKIVTKGLGTFTPEQFVKVLDAIAVGGEL